ncbi:T9SS type A sorting domain-containing protein [Flavobacterium sp. NRK F10]|uniref:T9SS type A sorting domain-containing protein n=1 Tax=Flavobacterium sp. NRK F10 TaxID=2954931 RepID=UPI0020905F0C|nr:T9SS type A sorting domain-containing protein [Flavobacterium sp. NRK F10]MCO6174288.1 T9SS type A sorting domain-containing protein [Flavobacterium sp. NRK F10]
MRKLYQLIKKLTLVCLLFAINSNGMVYKKTALFHISNNSKEINFTGLKSNRPVKPIKKKETANQTSTAVCTFTALTLSGFNADVIAEGTGGDTFDKTTHTVDAFYTFYSQDFVPLNPHSSGASATAYGGGFPTNGILSNTAISGLSFQLADFSSNNALVLRNNVTNQGNLTLASPKKAEKIYIAAVRGEGSSSSADNHNVTATVNFSDGSSQVFVFQATAWWYDSNPPANTVMLGTGEVSRNTATTGWAPKNEFRGLTQANLFYNELTLDQTNYNKNIVSIAFDKEVTANDAHTTAILGVSICETASQVTGFNYDIIANGIGDASSSADIGLDEVNTRALVSMDFQATAGSSFPTYGLPSDGIISSANTSGVSFQLADYSGPNALFLTPSYVTGSANSQNSGTLSFTASNVGNVYILSAAAGGGSSNLPYTAVVSFSDGTSQTANLQAKDWYDGTAYAIQGIGRVNMANNALEGSSTNPRLYEDVIALDVVNQTKTITGVTFTFDGDSTAPWANEIRLSVLAVTTTESTLSTSDFGSLDSTIKIYPNPSSGIITIDAVSELESVEIFNAIGQAVLNSKNKNQINISDLEEGIYMIRLKTKEGKTSVQKIIKK